MDGELLLTRRRALQAAGAAVAAAGATGIMTSAAGASPVPYSGFMRDDYTPHLGRTFTLMPPHGKHITARLAKVTDLPGKAGRGLTGSASAFILQFTAAAGQPFADQDVMRVVGPRGRSSRLFLVPGSRHLKTVTYTAVVNHTRPARRI